MFINAGIDKFFGYMPVPEDIPVSMIKVMTAFMEIGWFMPLVAVVEIVGGELFIIPKVRALGAIVIFPILIGILLTNIFNAPSGLPIALILLAVNIWVLIENRRKYLPMVQQSKTNF